MTVFWEFDAVEEFSASAVGDPGSRVFSLNARSGDDRVSVRCEKQQVRAIAGYLRQLLSDLPPPTDRPVVPPDEGGAPEDESFVLGPIGLGYDRSNDRLLVQLEEILRRDFDGLEDDDESAAAVPPVDEVDEVDDEVDDRGHIRFYVTRSQAGAFCDHADRLVAAGRPPCRWCGLPIDPDGHPCPRMN